IAQSTGRLIVVGDSNAGRSSAVPPRNRLQVVRLHADGSVDTSFASHGRRLVGLASGGSLTAVSAVPDGDAFYVLARQDVQQDIPGCVKRFLFDCLDLHHRIAVLRFTAAGTVDTSFGGGDGLVLLGAGSEHHGGANVAGTQRTGSFFRSGMTAARISRFGAPVWSVLADFPRLTADGNATAFNTSAALAGGLVALGGSVDLDPDRPTDISRHGRL